MYDIKRVKDIINAKLEGWISAAEVDELFDEISKIRNSTNSTRILIDTTHLSVLPDPAAVSLSSRLKTIERKIKLALLWRNDILFCSKFEEILEQISRPNILGFKDEKNAFNWLMDSEIPVLLGSRSNELDTTTLPENNLKR